MSIVLFVLCVLAFLAGAGILAAAQSAIHEIEAFLLFLISAVLLMGASVVDAIGAARRRIEGLLQGFNGSRAEVPKSHTAVSLPSAPVPSPALPPPAPRPYFFCTDGADSGPHSLEQMRLLRRSGNLKHETLVIRHGDTQWQPASMFPEICF